MNITIKYIDEFNAETDSTLLLAAIQRVKRFETFTEASIHLNARKPDGWLEYLAVVNFEGGRQPFVIGCIQRTPDSQPEFHS